ncbi:MAG: pyridoxal-phosphate dependent enzyme, partial [Deltaproteobacteria bacterium]
SHDPSIEIVGVQSSHVPGMAESITRGERIEAFYRPTIAEGIAIKRPGKINFEICRNHVDRFLQVDDDAIAQAILFLMERCKVVAEGAGAAALAPLLVASNPARWKGRKICVIVSGGNIDFHTISSIITRGLSRSGRFLQFSAHVPDTPGHLKKLVDGVSAVKGNILDITHDRTAPDLPLGYVKINIILETRNKAHGQQIVSDLSRLGYPIREIT